MRVPFMVALIQCMRNASAASSQCMTTSTMPASIVGTNGAVPLMARLMMEPTMIATMTSKALGFESRRRLPSRTMASVNT